MKATKRRGANSTNAHRLRKSKNRAIIQLFAQVVNQHRLRQLERKNIGEYRFRRRRRDARRQVVSQRDLSCAVGIKGGLDAQRAEARKDLA